MRLLRSPVLRIVLTFPEHWGHLVCGTIEHRPPRMDSNVFFDAAFGGLFDSELPDSCELDRALASALQNCVPACLVSDLQPEFLEKLYRVWRIEPFVCSSAFRSVDWERSRGRSGRSSHCKGLAVDIVCLDNLHRFRLVEAALSVGFTRIGIAKNFVHLDCDSSKPQQRIWTYDDKNNERKG